MYAGFWFQDGFCLCSCSGGGFTPYRVDVKLWNRCGCGKLWVLQAKATEPVPVATETAEAEEEEIVWSSRSAVFATSELVSSGSTPYAGFWFQDGFCRCRGEGEGFTAYGVDRETVKLWNRCGSWNLKFEFWVARTELTELTELMDRR